MNNIFENLSDKELFDKLDQAGLADRFLESQEGKLIKEASNRIVERAIAKFAMGGSKLAKDIVAIIELQTVIRKYKYGLFTEIDMLRKEGEFVFEEARSRRLKLDVT